MDQSILTKRISAAVNGMAQVGTRPTPLQQTKSETESFQSILQQKIAANTDLTFSKHAANRVMERNVDISESCMLRLNEGVRLAQEKGLNDTLIMVDSTAYIVNAKNGTVITTINNE
ncbi:MAG: flagellar protein, partial [Oscillospiraceae bacterium]